MSNNFDNLAHFSLEARFNTSFRELVNEREDQNVVFKLGKAATYKTFGRLAVDILPRYLAGYKFIDKGFEQLVFYSKKEDHVLKVIRDTIGGSEEEAQRRALLHQEQSDRCHAIYDDEWCETTYYPMGIPFFKDKYAVAAIQERIPIQATLSNTQEVLAQAHNPLVWDGIQRFIAKSRELEEKTGLQPDILRAGNLVVLPDHTLRMVDTLPFTSERQSLVYNGGPFTVGEMVRINLAAWETAIGAEPTEWSESRELVLH